MFQVDPLPPGVYEHPDGAHRDFTVFEDPLERELIVLRRGEMKDVNLANNAESTAERLDACGVLDRPGVSVDIADSPEMTLEELLEAVSVPNPTIGVSTVERLEARFTVQPTIRDRHATIWVPEASPAVWQALRECFDFQPNPCPRK